MSRRPFMRFSADVREGAVALRWYLTSRRYDASEESIPVRVFRRAEPDFEFGRDRAEYFSGLRPADADVLFEGRVETDGKKLAYRDDTVEVGGTYAYWIAEAGRDELPVGPRPVRVRNPDVYWPRARIDDRLDELDEREGVRTGRFGRTVSGAPIRGVLAGSRDRTVALVGLVHAGESGPELALPAVERLLEDRPDLLADVGVAVLPAANADERQRVVEGCPWYLRRNPNGVDINRNFDADWSNPDDGYGLNSADPDSPTYRGREPASEPETRAVISFVEAAEPETVLSFHYMASICGATFQAPETGEDDEYDERCRRIARAYTDGMYDAGRELTLRRIHTPGSLKTWLHREHGIPGFALEDDGGPNSSLARTDRTTPELLDDYRERHIGGVVRLLETIAEGTRDPDRRD